MNAIAAISTPPGYGGIGIIRISGKETFEVLKKIFVPVNKKTTIKGYSIQYGHIFDSKGHIIDEVLVSFFMEPKSFTTENLCEINSHGGPITLKKILELCLDNGARLAEPGEFTKLAFLNGRIDLTQAEAVIDVINAKTKKEQEASERILNGDLSKKIKDIHDKIMDVLVDIEASIDYPEYDIEAVTTEKIYKMIDYAEEKINKILNNYETGKLIREGIKIAIIGRPNAGKSSLLNAILNEERAIVTEIEGTTRDTIEEYIVINGIQAKIIDTAGIREKTKDEIEKIGIEKSKKMAEEADLVIAIFDSSKELQEEDYEILKIIKNKKSLIILNKSDLQMKVTRGQ